MDVFNVQQSEIDNLPTMSEQLERANLPIIDYQIRFIETQLIPLLMILFDFLQVPYEETFYSIAGSLNHPAVMDCGKTIATCGPWELIWENYVKIYN